MNESKFIEEGKIGGKCKMIYPGCSLFFLKRNSFCKVVNERYFVSFMFHYLFEFSIEQLLRIFVLKITESNCKFLNSS